MGDLTNAQVAPIIKVDSETGIRFMRLRDVERFVTENSSGRGYWRICYPALWNFCYPASVLYIARTVMLDGKVTVALTTRCPTASNGRAMYGLPGDEWCGLWTTSDEPEAQTPTQRMDAVAWSARKRLYVMNSEHYQDDRFGDLGKLAVLDSRVRGAR